MKEKINVREEFKKHGIKTSYQRIKIYNCLCKGRVHPTADDIYRELVNDIPTLSKTTVYNNLAMFIEKNMANEVKTDKNEARYELNRGFHGHFKCDKCGEIYDFRTEFAEEKIPDLAGFEIGSKNLYLTGICPNCKKAIS